jgi:hypothetical protein
MRFPIDMSRLQFPVVGEAGPLRKFEADKPRERWAPRVDDNGEVLWRVQVVALGLGEAEIIRVAVPGEPSVHEGESVRVEGLTAQPWENEGRWGISFRAGAIKPATARAEKAA